jgi:hypothetical protein
MAIHILVNPEAACLPLNEELSPSFLSFRHQQVVLSDKRTQLFQSQWTSDAASASGLGPKRLKRVSRLPDSVKDGFQFQPGASEGLGHFLDEVRLKFAGISGNSHAAHLRRLDSMEARQRQCGSAWLR